VRQWLAVGIALGPIALLAASMFLLNRRDRRRDALEATIGVCLAELGLRGAVAVDVGVGVWLGGPRVMLDMRLCSAQHVWRVIERLHPRLPRGAGLWIVATGPSSQPPTAFHRAVVALL
jgi:hypothetical protein